MATLLQYAMPNTIQTQLCRLESLDSRRSHSHFSPVSLFAYCQLSRPNQNEHSVQQAAKICWPISGLRSLMIFHRPLAGESWTYRPWLGKSFTNDKISIVLKFNEYKNRKYRLRARLSSSRSFRDTSCVVPELL